MARTATRSGARPRKAPETTGARGAEAASTDGLRITVAVAGVLLGWSLARELLLGPRLSDGTLSVAPALEESIGARLGAALIVFVAVAALVCLQRGVRRRAGEVFPELTEWAVSASWWVPGLVLAALLPTGAMLCVLGTAGLGVLLSRVEGSALDLPVAVVAHGAALLLGVAAAYAVTEPASLLVGRMPRWGGWSAWELPRDLLGAPFLLVAAFVLCARVSYVLAPRAGEADHAQPGRGALAILGFSGCFIVLIIAIWQLFAATEYRFGWAQPNYAQMGSLCCLIALLRLLTAWTPRRLRLDPRAALAAGILLHAGLAYGLGESIVTVFVLGAAFAVHGRPAPRPPQRKASGLAGRIRPSAWPWVR